MRMPCEVCEPGRCLHLHAEMQQAHKAEREQEWQRLVFPDGVEALVRRRRVGDWTVIESLEE